MDDDFFADDRKSNLGRLEVLGGQVDEPQAQKPQGYSNFIRWMKFVLPVLALGMVALVFSWNEGERMQVEPEAIEATPRTIGQNELLNPVFESVDEKGQPYKITATRALQSRSEDDMVILEAPMADIAMEDGSWLAVRADQSAFRQATQRLLMKGSVEIFHDEGYTLLTEEMDVDMGEGTARSDVSVKVQGPLGAIDASGVEANRLNGTLIFKGPAKLILKAEAL